RDVEELRSTDELRFLGLVTPELFHATLNGVAILGILVLDDADGDAVDDEHDVGAVALARRRFQLPLPGDMKFVLVGRLEINEANATVALFGVVVPLSFAAKPA